MNNQIYPKCHPYWNINGKKVYNQSVKGPAYTAEGYILPCCWCDREQPELRKEFELFGFYETDLKVSNIEDIYSDILLSHEWYDFHKTLLQSPNDAPKVCKLKCGDFNTSSAKTWNVKR